MNLNAKARNLPKETWLAVFILLVAFYFLTLSNFPGGNSITGTHSISSNKFCEWDYLTDEFQVKDVLTLELDEFFFSSSPLEFHAYSNDGSIFIKDDLLVFFPEKEFNTITIVAKNEEISCSKTLKIINV